MRTGYRPLPQHADETSIMVVAKHSLVRAGLRALLGATPGFRLVPDSRDLAGAVDLARRHLPDVVLAEERPLGDTDRRAIENIRAELPAVCILFLGGTDTRDDGFPCLPSGAGLAEFCTTLGTLLGGRCVACTLRSRCPKPQLIAALTPRERQVAVSVAAGRSSKQIASALGIGLRTVNTYRESLARKIGGSSAAILTRYVIESGLDVVTG